MISWRVALGCRASLARRYGLGDAYEVDKVLCKQVLLDQHFALRQEIQRGAAGYSRLYSTVRGRETERERDGVILYMPRGYWSRINVFAFALVDS